MRLKGTLVEWNDARGFGFIEPVAGGGRVFCHISKFAVRSRRPAPGQCVTYELSRDERGQLRASQIRPPGVERRVEKERQSSTASPWTALVVSVAFLMIVMGLAVAGRVPWFVPAGYAIMSLITVFAYAFDKSAAMNRRWRTQEMTLHILALLGGWPGAWISQRLFHHKTRKAPFMIGFLFCTVANIAVLAWLAVSGSDRLRGFLWRG